MHEIATDSTKMFTPIEPKSKKKKRKNSTANRRKVKKKNPYLELTEKMMLDSIRIKCGVP